MAKKKWAERANDPEFMDDPMASLALFEGLSPDDREELQTALMRRDEKKVEKILGLKEGEFQKRFQTLKGKAEKICDEYPELLDPNKGFSE